MGPDDKHGDYEEVAGQTHGCTTTVFEVLFELRRTTNVEGDVFC